MGAVPNINFDHYLKELVSTYRTWWRFYSLTDAIDTEPQGDERQPAWFDFGLMVKTVQPSQERQESEQDQGKKEKIEHLPVLEGISKYAAEHVLLVGRSGAGKSTTLAHLLLQKAKQAIADCQAAIPVLLELRYLPSEPNQLSVIEGIQNFIQNHDPALELDAAKIRQLLDHGQLLLLVDGLNDLRSPSSRNQINIFRHSYQKTCPMIFTTRDLSLGGDLGIAKKLEIQPLTELQIQQFVKTYLPTQGDRLLPQLQKRFGEYGQTPLLLWMLYSLLRQSASIPSNLAMVLRTFTQSSGKTTIKQDLLTDQDACEWQIKFLQYLAFAMIGNDHLPDAKLLLSRQEAEQILSKFLQGKVENPSDHAILSFQKLSTHNLLRLKGDRIEFCHQLIQEYYAAEYLLEILSDLSDTQLKHDYLNYLKWTEPLALMLGLVEDRDRALQVVQLALAVDLQLGTKLVGAVKPEFQESSIKLLIQFVTELEISQVLMIELLLQTQSDVIIAPLIQLLQSDDGQNREQPRKVGRSKAIKLLIQDLQNSDVRCKAAVALGKIGNDQAIPALIQALKDEYSSVRGSAATALGNISSDKAVAALIQSLKDIDSDVRGKAAAALEKIASDHIVIPLIAALQDESLYVRGKAANVLEKIGSDKTVEFLIKTLASLNSDVRSRAAEILGLIGNDKAVFPLIQLLQNQDSDVCGRVAEALGKIGSDTAVLPLIQALNHEDSYVRGRVAAALGKIGNHKATEPLMRSLQDEDSNVRGSAAAALGKIGDDIAIPPLLQVLQDEYAFVRGNAEESLKGIAEANQNLHAFTPHLPYLVSLIPTIASKNALRLITTIQAQCKYYS